ncbi:MAG: hypothetical protein GXO68_05660 [Crenarchaeota archaeon]|nr:hypothetical protein [Thermoproteota archaeon]
MAKKGGKEMSVMEKLDKIVSERKDEWINIEIARVDAPTPLLLELSVSPEDENGNRVAYMRLRTARIDNAIKLGPQHVESLILLGELLTQEDVKAKLREIALWLSKFSANRRRGAVRISI